MPIFHRKIETSLWKIGIHEHPGRYLQKMIRVNFDISIFADFTAAEIGKNSDFWRLSSRTAQKNAKNQNFKNSSDHFVELYIRINHAKF